MHHNFPFILVSLAALIIAMISYGIFLSRYQVIWGAKVPENHPSPRHSGGSMVSHGNSGRMQVIRIRLTDEGEYEYKIRYYNALFGAYWVTEKEL